MHVGCFGDGQVGTSAENGRPVASRAFFVLAGFCTRSGAAATPMNDKPIYRQLALQAGGKTVKYDAYAPIQRALVGLRGIGASASFRNALATAHEQS